MNKKLIYFGFAIVFMTIFSFCACSGIKTTSSNVLPNDIMVSVDDEYISESRLNDRILYSKIFNESLFRTLKESHTEEMFPDYELSTDKSTVKENLIQDAVIRHYLDNDALVFKDVSNVIDGEIQKMKKENGPLYVHTEEVIEEYDISFEKYEELLKDYYYDYYNRLRLQQKFGNEEYDEKSVKSFDEQFNKFLDDLVKKTKIWFSD